MPPPSFIGCSPWVRLAKIQEDRGLAGEWVDFDHVFTLVDRGRGEFVFDGLRLRAGPGTLVVMPPGLRHVVRALPGPAFAQFIVHFDLRHRPRRAAQRRIGLGALPAGLDLEPSLFAGPLHAQLPAAAAEVARGRFAELRRACAGERPVDHLRRQAALLDLLALGLEHAAGTPAAPVRPSKPWQALDRAVAALHARLDDPALDLAAVARAAGVSRAYLPELFRRHLGLSVRRHLIHLRVRRARHLLAGGATVTAAAEATGFSGIHAFSRAFRRIAGMPPSAVMVDGAGAGNPPPG